ncbi:MAG: ABC transporter ATP-binding protein [Acidimicrobiales bacterium]
MSAATPVIEVEGLRKEYRRIRGRTTVAVDGLDLSVPSGGGVFGFLGPNGAGKTTTVRCLLGLVRPSAGQLRLFGVDSQRDLASVIRRVGSIVETPALFPGFSGRRNLALLGRVVGVGTRRVDEVLELVGLAERADDKVKGYSLGMRQRLGMGAALLRDPELLVLDEPVNGLDPAGIRDTRQLLRRLGDEGRTVFLSSHLLGEVQQLCDHVTILARGRLIAAGPVAEVLDRGRASGVLIKVADTDRAQDTLAKAGYAVESTHDGDELRVSVAPAQAADITKVLAAAGLYLHELRPDEVDLETVFLELTSEDGA